MARILFAGLSLLALAAGGAIAQTPAAAPTPQALDLEIAGPSFRVTDLERSLKFYTEGLGLQVSRRMAAGQGSRAILTAPGKGSSPFINLFQNVADPAKSAPIVPGTGYERIFISVTNSAALAARLKAAGYAVRGTSGTIYFVDDPDGYHIEIVQRQAAAR